MRRETKTGGSSFAVVLTVIVVVASVAVLAGALLSPASAEAGPTGADTQGQTMSCGDPLCFGESQNLEVTRSGASDLTTIDRDGEEALVRVHQWGTVAAMTMEGQTLWERQHRSLRLDWGLLGDHLPPRISMGPVADPGKDFGSEHHASPVATRDVSGDGVEDVFVAHNWVRDDRPFIYGIVSLFDGSDGQMLWHETYRGVIAGIALQGEMLVVAEENGEPPYSAISPGEPGGRSALHGVALQSTQDGVQATQTWRLEWPDADWGVWTGPAAAGPDRVAVALTPAEGLTSTLMMVEADSGTIVWSSQRQGVVDFIRYDDQSDEIAFTQSMPEVRSEAGGSAVHAAGNGFRLLTAAVEDATVRMSQLVQASGTPQQLAVADATGDGVPDYLATGQIVPAPTTHNLFFTNTHLPFPARSSVTLVDGATGLPLWQRTTGAMGLPGPAGKAEAFVPPNPSNITGAHGIAAVDGIVVVASADTAAGPTDNRHLQAFDGLTGLPVWSTSGKQTLTPSSLLVSNQEAQASVLGISKEGLFQARAPTDGTRSTSSALLVDVHHAVATDITHDGAENLVVGAKSGGVFALANAASLPRDDPSFLWNQDLDGPVHEMKTRDVTGDGIEEIVVAAENEIAVLEAETGDTHLQIPYPDAFVWTVTIADVDQDGSQDLLVPTNGLDAYRGSDGTQLWAYEPVTVPGERAHLSNAAVVDGVVVTQYSTQWQPGVDQASNLAEGARAFPFGSIPQRSAIIGLQGADGTELWSQSIPQSEGYAALWNSVAAAPQWPGADGQGVAVMNHAGDVAMGFLLGSETVLRMLDAASGEDLLDQPLGPGHARLGVKALSSGALVAYGGHGLQEVASSGLRELPTYSTWGVGMGSFGTHGQLAVTSGAYSTFVVDPSEEYDDAFVGRGSSGVALGDAIAADLSGNGIDEVVAFPPDRELYTRLTLAQGAPGFGVSVSPLGIAVFHVDVQP